MVRYPEAEGVVAQFARKSTEPGLAWNSDVGKLSDYIGGKTQKSTDWDQRRLALALRGYFTTKVMFLPTHTLVACVAAFGSTKEEDEHKKEKQIVPQEFLEKLINSFTNKKWRQPSQALSFLSTIPMVYLLKGQGTKSGSRRGASSSLEAARSAFSEINQYITKDGSDQPINKCLAIGLREALQLDKTQVLVEADHP